MNTENKIKILLSIFCIALSSNIYAQTQIDTSTSEATATRPDTGNVTPTAEEDKIITQSIKKHIKNSSTLSKLKVEVKTTQGEVTLSGNVDSNSQASALIELAQSIIGVKDVDAANLKVKASDQPFTDMVITAKIKGLFIREEVFGTKDISSVNLSVETKNGVVYLTGAADNQEQISNAIKLAQSVNGVKKVEYNVKKVTPTSDAMNGSESSPKTNVKSYDDKNRE